MNAEDWLSAYAERIGTPPPTRAELGALLALAGAAAHASERIAAPVACWMAAMAGVAPEDALALAREIPAGAPPAAVGAPPAAAGAPPAAAGAPPAAADPSPAPADPPDEGS